MSFIFPDKPELTETQSLILAAAIRCVKRFGIDRVSLHDIAKEASVARSTVYSHYLNKDDVVRFALLYSAFDFADKVVSHVEEFPEGAERLLEAMLFCLKALPDEPCLALILDTGFSQMVNQHTLTTEAGFSINTSIFSFLAGERRLPKALIQEQAEITLRTLFSLMTLQSPLPRDEETLKGFIARWLLPALQIEVPDSLKCQSLNKSKELADEPGC